MKIRKYVFKETYIISNFSKSYNNNKIFELSFDNQFTNNSLFRINAKYNYNYYNINNFSHVYKFYNNNQKFNEITLYHKDSLNNDIINDQFNMQTINSSKIKLLVYIVNSKKDNSLVELYDYNSIEIIYEDYIDTFKFDLNRDNIVSNLEKINSNTDLNNKFKQSADLAIYYLNQEKPKISKNITDIAYSLLKINANEKNILSNSNKIKEISDIKVFEGENCYILKDIHIIDLNYVKNLKIDNDKIEVLVQYEIIYHEFNINDYLQLNEYIYYDFEDVKLNLNLIKEHYIFKDENDNIIYYFEYYVSSRGSIFKNSYMLKK